MNMDMYTGSHGLAVNCIISYNKDPYGVSLFVGKED